MRTFHSYGPVDLAEHFGVPRTELVQHCVQQLIGNPDKGGHYFTIWAPRQTGKTWVIQQAMEEVRRQYGDQFAMVKLSFGKLSQNRYLSPDEHEGSLFFKRLARLLKRDLPGEPDVTDMDDFYELFLKSTGLWDRPVLLLIDEMDTVPSAALDMMAKQFRELYLARDTNWLHGLALIGVRSVLGVESTRGSPFNVQRSLPIPKLTWEEVREMYQQYQTESGQPIDPAVVAQVYETTRGQPGLVSWFGALLTEREKSTPDHPITCSDWYRVRNIAHTCEPNNTILNLAAKAQDPTYQPFLLSVYSQPNLPFYFHHPMHNYLYMHGLIEPKVIQQSATQYTTVCRFTCPFIQEYIYLVLHYDVVNMDHRTIAVYPPKRLLEICAPDRLHVPLLVASYQDYLARLHDQGINPWKDQPRRRTDQHLTEAVGHFHLYAWLLQALDGVGTVSPEFPTGNGQVDLLLTCDNHRGLIEVKSYVNIHYLVKSRTQTAQYAQQLLLDRAVLVVFIEIQDESVLAELSGIEIIEGIEVTTMMIRWGW